MEERHPGHRERSNPGSQLRRHPQQIEQRQTPPTSCRAKSSFDPLVESGSAKAFDTGIRYRTRESRLKAFRARIPTKRFLVRAEKSSALRQELPHTMARR